MAAGFRLKDGFFLPISQLTVFHAGFRFGLQVAGWSSSRLLSQKPGPHPHCVSVALVDHIPILDLVPVASIMPRDWLWSGMKAVMKGGGPTRKIRGRVHDRRP